MVNLKDLIVLTPFTKVWDKIVIILDIRLLVVILMNG